jgi:hypothetical protein
VRGNQLRAATCVAALALVMTASSAAAAGGELSQVAATNQGSSNPTFFATNRRQAITEGGRQLVVYDPHGSGQQLAWRDGSGPWRTTTRGVVGNGALPVDTSSGDRAASIAIARDSGGAEHAWVAWAAQDFEYAVGVQLVRLSELDDPAGPVVGQVTTVTPPGLGNVGADLVFEGSSGLVSWLRRTGSSSYAVTVARFTNLDTDTPSFEQATLFQTSSGSVGTLVPTPGGTVLVVRASGALTPYTHSAGAPLGSWSSGSGSVTVGSEARPSAVLLASGDVLAAVESKPSRNKVKVVRFAPGGGVTTELSLSGYEEPSLATDGSRAWVVMVKASNDSVVSRQRAGGSWSSSDRVELTAADGGDWAWPNLVRNVESGLLRLVVDGPRCTCSTKKNAVYAYQRAL